MKSGTEIRLGILVGVLLTVAVGVAGLLRSPSPTPSPPPLGEAPDAAPSPRESRPDEPRASETAPDARASAREEAPSGPRPDSGSAAPSASDPTSPPPGGADRLRGQVLGPEGVDLAEASVRVRGRPDLRASVSPLEGRPGTSSTGRFVIEGVPPGRSVLEAHHPDGLHGVAIARVMERTDVPFAGWARIHLSRGAATVGGTVRHADRPREGAEVRVHEVREGRMGNPPRPGSLRGVVTTDGSGRFVLEHLARGPHALIAEDRAEGLRSEVVEVEVGEGSEREVDLVLEPAATLEGRVVDDLDRPVVGARVRADSSDPLDEIRGGEAVETGADGSFRVGGLRASEVYDLRVRPGRDHDAPTLREVEAPAADLLVRCRARATLVIHPRTGDGSPVEGVEIELRRSGSARTHGSRDAPVRLRGIRPGTWEVTVRAPGHGATSLGAVRLEAGREVTRTVTLSPAPRVRGRVLDPDGRPASDVVVVLTRPRSRVQVDSLRARDRSARSRTLTGGPRARTGEDGRFTLPMSRESGLLVAVAEEHPPARLPLDGPPDEPVELELSRGGSLAGTVRRPDGSPAEGTVQAWSEGVSRSTEIRAGRFRLVGLGPGEWDVRIHVAEVRDEDEEVRRVSFGRHGAPGGRRVQRTVRVAAGEETWLDIRPDPLVATRVRLLRGDRPVAGARVTLRGVEATDSQASGRTGPEGRVVLEGLRPGPHRVRVDLRSERSTRRVPVGRVEVRPDEDEESVLRLPAGVLAGQVVHAEDGEGLEGIHVSIWSRPSEDGARPSRPGRAVSGPDGSFRITDLPPGPYRLHAGGERYLRAQVEAEARPDPEAGEPGEVRIELTPALPIAGTIRDPRGVPVPGANVSIRATDSGTRARAVRSQASGRYEAFVPPGTYEVRVRSRGLARARVPSVEVREATELDVDLRPAGTLVLRLVDPEGRPARGRLHVRLLYPDGARAAYLWQPETGERTAVDDLASGTYGVRVSRRDEGEAHVVGRGTATVVAGETRTEAIEVSGHAPPEGDGR